MTKRIGVGLTAVLLAAVLPVGAQFNDAEVEGEPALCAFLESAEIVESHQMSESEGVTEPYRLTLASGDTKRDALWKNPTGRVKGFIEGWQYEIAAYRLDRHLGVNMVPPTVERRFDGNRGSCQVWVDVMMSMRDKQAKNANPPSEKIRSWNNAVYLQRAFDNLIANEDRHLGNILITEDWRMILIDHSRSFRSSKKHTKQLMFSPQAKGREGPKPMRRLPRSFLDKLKALDSPTVKEVVGDYLTDQEIEAMLIRRDMILAEIDRLVAENGEGATLY